MYVPYIDIQNDNDALLACIATKTGFVAYSLIVQGTPYKQVYQWYSK